MEFSNQAEPKFTLQAKRYFLTYPKCDKEKSVVCDYLSTQLGAHQVLVSEEKHEDGSPHLHVFLSFEKAKRVSKADFFDVDGFHPNIQTVKNMKECIKYITKDDKEPAQYNFDYKAVINGKSSKFAVVAQKILDGMSLFKLNEEEPGFVLQHKRKIEEYEAWVAMKRPRLDLLPWELLPVPAFGPERQIAEWCNSNLFKPRPLKSPQLYIFSPPNCGKTTFVQFLERFCRIYYMSLLEDFYDFYDDDSYDLVVIDEFKGQKTIQFLNQFLDGQTCTIRIKGGQRIKRRNIPVIILSNWPLNHVYSGAIDKHGHDAIAPLIARLEIVSVNSFIKFYNKE